MSDKNANDGIVVGFWVLVLCSLVLLFINFKLYSENKFYSKGYDYYKEQSDYLLDGASKRRYVDLCKNDKGVVGVWFKDECKD